MPSSRDGVWGEEAMERTDTGNFKGHLGGWLVLALLGVILVSAWGCSRPVNRGYGLKDVDGFLATVRPVSTDPARLLRNAHYFQLMGRQDLALKELEEAYVLDPNNLKVTNALARTYEALGDYPRARQIYQEALARHPDQPALANNRCFSYYLEAKWPEAEACFKAALARNPKNDAARNNLGLLYCRQGRQDEAQRLWKDAGGEAVAQSMMHQAMAALGKVSDNARVASPPPAPPAAARPVPPQMAAAAPVMGTPIVGTPGPPEGESPSPGPKPVLQVRGAAPLPKPTAAPALTQQPDTEVAIASHREPPTATKDHQAEAPLTPPAKAPKLTAQELGGTQIVVLNGAGINKLAHRVRSILHNDGYNVARIGNHIDFGAHRTIIYYRPEAQRVAQALNAEHFPQSTLEPSGKMPPGADVKIVLGKELAALDQMAGLQSSPEDG